LVSAAVDNILSSDGSVASELITAVVLLDEFVPNKPTSNFFGFRDARALLKFYRKKIARVLLLRSHTRVEKLMLCGSCKVMSYCSKECQKESLFKRHFKDCTSLGIQVEGSKMLVRANHHN
jgi:hypothetical protein